MAQTPFEEVASKLQELGLERGWGKDVERIRSTVGQLLDVLQAPDASLLEGFLSRLPIVHKVAILSPHGFFGQANVLGKPDTGGQVQNAFFFLPLQSIASHCNMMLKHGSNFLAAFPFELSKHALSGLRQRYEF